MERVCAEHDSLPWREAERRALCRFREYTESDLPYRPDPDDHLGWLALLQHYGGPTRLLDFTYSMDVAAYFALEAPSNTKPAVWAVNGLILAAVVEDQGSIPKPRPNLQVDSDRWWFFNKCFDARFTGYCAYVTRPPHVDPRHVKQEATFLCSLNPNHGLMANLFGMFDLDPTDMVGRANRGYYNAPFADHVQRAIRRSPFVKIVLDFGDRIDTLCDLNQNGISRATLFPGVDGYAFSLRHRIGWDGPC